MLSIKETKLAGLLLFIGSLIILITIYFEYTSGWIGTDRPEEETPIFIFENWTALRLIWGWQVVGYFLWTCSFFLLFKESKKFYSLSWSVLIICSFSMVIAFLITLGSYYPVLEVYDQTPALFDSLRAAVRSIYNVGLFGIFLILILFIYEMIHPKGRITKSVGITTIAVFVILLIIGALTSLSLTVTGASIFFFPLILGYSIWREKA